MLQRCEGSVWNSSQYGEGLQGWEPFSVLNAAPLVDPQWLFRQVVYQLVWAHALSHCFLSELIWYCIVLGDLHLWLHNNSFHIKSTGSCSLCTSVTCVWTFTLKQMYYACMYTQIVSFDCCSDDDDGKTNRLISKPSYLILDNPVKPYSISVCIYAVQRETIIRIHYI